ncbi:MAG: bacteriohemerythrin [Proteobacteria bacterium]|nr:bacteriohemerythrin [Pseudomonadota bacterium]
MDIINWRDEFSVGVAEMDQQHKKLLAMINRLIAEQKVLTDPKTIADLLTSMIDYADEHFRAEEFLMAEYGYDRKTEQEEAHRAFAEKTQSFCSTAYIGPNILSEALLDFLGTWLVGHILREDMQYKEFFKSKGLS